MFRDVHRLALTYHWGRGEILSLPLLHRQRYLMLIEAEQDTDLFSSLGEELR
ncbi:hypothetical protein [Cystobacter ferrugineus]|uniref:hypothetical protein n=1 Tax=Cystobacter ferrugineus TaxID=83449 RepID=UPI00165199AA|nr:hypothetical protein [Cystobacter ferrugineus]